MIEFKIITQTKRKWKKAQQRRITLAAYPAPQSCVLEGSLWDITVT